DLLPEVTARLGTGAITIPLWDDSLLPAAAEARADALLPVVSRLLSSWQDITFALSRVPQELSRRTRLDADDPWGLLLMDEKVWRPYAGPFFDKFGQRVSRWQVGAAGDDRAFSREKREPEI